VGRSSGDGRDSAFPALLEAFDDPFFEQPIAFLGGQPARVGWRDAARRIAAVDVHKQDAFASEVIDTELDKVLDRGKDITTALADAQRPWAWKYRDYVTKSLNEDKPVDRFIVEQLAGDELAGPQQGDWTSSQIELLTATGFLRMTADGTGSGDNSPEAKNKTIADTIQVIGSSLLGSSLNCAQCHDHRYDPISHEDYFALRAVLDPALDWQQWKTPPERLISLYTQADRDLSAQIEKEAQSIAAERATKEAESMKEALDKELMKFQEPMRASLRAAYETPADKRTDEQKMLLEKTKQAGTGDDIILD
jgi:hypothetical protein